MDRDTSLVVLGVSLAAAVAGWFGDRARRRAPLARHALVPWHALLFAGLTGTMFMAIHLIASR